MDFDLTLDDLLQNLQDNQDENQDETALRSRCVYEPADGNTYEFNDQR